MTDNSDHEISFKLLNKKTPTQLLISTPTTRLTPNSYHSCGSTLYGPLRGISPIGKVLEKMSGTMKMDLTVSVATKTIFSVEDGCLTVDWQLMLKPKSIKTAELQWQISQLKEGATFIEGFSDERQMELVESTLLLYKNVLFLNHKSSMDFSGRTAFFTSNVMENLCPVKWTNGEKGQLTVEEIYASKRTRAAISKQEALILSFGKAPKCAEELRNDVKMVEEVKSEQELARIQLKEDCIVKDKSIVVNRKIRLPENLWSQPSNWSEQFQNEYFLIFPDVFEKPIQKVSDTINASPTMLTFPQNLPLPLKQSNPNHSLPLIKITEPIEVFVKRRASKSHVGQESLKEIVLPPFKRKILEKHLGPSKELDRTEVSKCPKTRRSRRRNAEKKDSIEGIQLERQNKNTKSSEIIGQLKTFPNDTLTINAPLDQPQIHPLELKNEGDKAIAWAVKTNCKKLFYAEPVNGVLESGKTIYLTLNFHGFIAGEEPKVGEDRRERLTVQYTEVESGTTFSLDLFTKDNITIVKKVIHVIYNN